MVDAVILTDDIYEYTEEQITEAIRAGIPEQGAFFAYLTRLRLDYVKGNTEFDRGIAEGMRTLAAELQDRARAKKLELIIKTNKGP
jgi:hypothetical protein